MDQVVTGALIRRLREARHMTQAELAGRLSVSDKAVSKWETGRGYPDVSLLPGLAEALGVSVAELLAGSGVTNRNRAFNMLRSCLYRCPVCGNVLLSSGEAMISCCGVTLRPMAAAQPDDGHALRAEIIEDEYYVTMDHDMTREHYITFFAAVGDGGVHLAMRYPEGSADAYFPVRGTQLLLACCNQHGLFALRPAPRRR